MPKGVFYFLISVFFLTQATTAEYQKFEAGNELSFFELEGYLATSCPGKSWFKDIVPQARTC
jgi:hypothetical protein